MNKYKNRKDLQQSVDQQKYNWVELKKKENVKSATWETGRNIVIPMLWHATERQLMEKTTERLINNENNW